MSDHHLRAFSGRRDLIDVQRRSIRSQNRIGFSNGVDLSEDLLLQLHLLEHRLHNDVRFAEAIIGQHRSNQRHPLIHHRLREPAFLYRILVVLSDGRDSAVKRRLRRLLQQHRNPRIRVVHRDAAAHGSRADHRGLPDRQQGRVLGNVRDLRDRPFPEEGVDQTF